MRHSNREDQMMNDTEKIQAAKFQSRASLLLWVICFGIFLLSDLVARNTAVEDWFRSRELVFRERTNSIFPNTGFFSDYEDCLLLDELNGADYSRGGVYFIGSSNMKWGVMPWELPNTVRTIIHNYAIGSTNHTLQYQLIRYLVDHTGWLEAGGEKTHVIFGICYRSAVSKDEFFGSLWLRHGFYSYDLHDGIVPAGKCSFVVNYAVERERCAGFLRTVAREIKRGLKPGAPAREKHDQQAYRQRLVESIEATDWQTVMSSEIEQLGDMIHYLKLRGVGCTVILLPRISWTDELPYPQVYYQGVEKVCEEEGVEFIDDSHLFRDEYFVDSSHLTVTGLRQQNKILMEIALGKLHEMNAVKEP